MPKECQNCGAAVSDAYVRVFAPPGEDSVRVCPKCPDLIREDGSTVREARSSRRK